MAENTLDKEFNDQSYGFQRLIGIGLLLCLIVFIVAVGVRYLQAADPYIHEVLSLDGNQERGKDIFQLNCAVCHGIEAEGEVGPSLLRVSVRKSQVKLIKQVVSGNTPPMPQFQPVAQDMADLLKYLDTL